MTGAGFSTRLPAEPDSVTALIEALEGFAEAEDLHPRLANRLALVAEEIAANVVNHAVGATYFALHLRPEGTAMLMELEDDGPAFDPLTLEAPDTGAALEDREIGGLGVMLVRKLARRAGYARDGAVNRLSVLLDAET